jgi:hypothetical protein
LELTEVSGVRTASIVIALMIQVVRTFEASANFNVTARRYKTEESKFHICRCEDPKSHKYLQCSLSWNFVPEQNCKNDQLVPQQIQTAYNLSDNGVTFPRRL